MFRAVVRTFTADGFVKFRIEGQKGEWKLDYERGWLLDEGQAIDRLFSRRMTRI